MIAALREELAPLLGRLDFKKAEAEALPYFVGSLASQNGELTICAVIQREMGGIEAAALTSRAICVLRPTRGVIMTGVMGGFKANHVSLGDVVIATMSVDYAFGKVSSV